MNGLELSKLYWENIGRPEFEKKCPELLQLAAVGLVGEGSECFGYDDELSRDHDWGPGFCIWLSKEDCESFGDKAAEIYAGLPAKYMGFERLQFSELSNGRVGVLETGAFYRRFIGTENAPKSYAQWFTAPEHALATVTNGEVFADPKGDFSRTRKELLNYYPEDIRLKKLAANCALAAQSGQYNYPRCMKRDDHVAALMTLTEFIDHVQAICFLLAKRYRPYYKWAQRAMSELPGPAGELAPMIASLTAAGGNCSRSIEDICDKLIAELRAQGLSCSGSDFLLPHAALIQEQIRSPELRSLHLMAK